MILKAITTFPSKQIYRFNRLSKWQAIYTHGVKWPDDIHGLNIHMDDPTTNTSWLKTKWWNLDANVRTFKLENIYTDDTHSKKHTNTWKISCRRVITPTAQKTIKPPRSDTQPKAQQHQHWSSRRSLQGVWCHCATTPPAARTRSPTFLHQPSSTINNCWKVEFHYLKAEDGPHGHHQRRLRPVRRRHEKEPHPEAAAEADLQHIRGHLRHRCAKIVRVDDRCGSGVGRPRNSLVSRTRLSVFGSVLYVFSRPRPSDSFV